MIPTYFVQRLQQASAQLQIDLYWGYMCGELGPKRDALILLLKGIEQLHHASLEDCVACEIEGFGNTLAAVDTLIKLKDDPKLWELRATCIELREKMAEYRTDQEICRSAEEALPRAKDGSLMLN
jgi:hypothetical protein